MDWIIAEGVETDYHIGRNEWHRVCSWSRCSKLRVGGIRARGAYQQIIFTGFEDEKDSMDSTSDKAPQDSAFQPSSTHLGLRRDIHATRSRP